MPIMPEVYMAQLFVTTVAVTIICAILLVGVFLPDIGLIAWYESRPDMNYALACYEWEYWNADLVDETPRAEAARTSNTWNSQYLQRF